MHSVADVILNYLAILFFFFSRGMILPFRLEQKNDPNIGKGARYLIAFVLLLTFYLDIC